MAQREGREKIGKRREVQEIQVWNIFFCMELMFGNTCLSWVRKTLTLQYMCILISLSQFCSFVLKWFDLVKRFSVKMAKVAISVSSTTPLRLGVGVGAWAEVPKPRRTRGRFFQIF